MPEITYSVSDRTAAYLRWLSRNIIMEKTESLVARHLMMGVIERMRRKFGPQEPHSIDEWAGAQTSEQTEKDDT